MKGLIIKSPHIERILDGKKTWEIRGSKTSIRGRIALIKSGSGKIFGEVDLVDCKGPMTLKDMKQNKNKTCQDEPRLFYDKTYAWILENPGRYNEPKEYDHPQGAVIWVNL